MKRLFTVIAAALVLGLALATAYADTHKDEKLGYSFVHPKKWDPMPLGSGSDFLVAKFVNPRQYEWQDKESWGFLKPYIEVLVIPLAASEDKGASVTKTDKGVRIDRAVEYSDLREYLDLSTRSIGGFYFSGETETEVNGMKCIQYELTVDKLVQGERRVIGWAYYTEDAIYGFVGQFFVQDEKKLRPDFEKSFKSFKAFPRTGSLPLSVRTGEDIVIDDGKGEDLTPEERRKRRDELTTRTLNKIKSTLADDWDVREGDHFIAVTHADKKYTKELLDHADALREWLDEELGYLGSGYVGKFILRICKDYEEYSAYWDTRDWASGSPEIVTYQREGSFGVDAMQPLNQSIWRSWISDRNEALRWAAPRFLEDGLLETITYAQSKRGKMEFPPDVTDELYFKELDRDGKLVSVKKFFTMTSEEFFASMDIWRQNRFFVRYLLVGKGSKNSKYKGILSDYIRNLIVMVDEEQAAEPEAVEHKEATSEEEEDALYRERQQAWRQKEKERLQRLVDETFKGWTDKDWEKLDTLYRKAVT